MLRYQTNQVTNLAGQYTIGYIEAAQSTSDLRRREILDDIL
jgi:hypothetical protein